MKYYKTDSIFLYNGNCLNLLKRLDNGIIDLTITSPHYNLGNTHHTGNYRHQTYDDNLPENEYQKAQIDVLNELFRVTKDTGSLIYNHKNRIKKGIQITPYEWLLKTSWIVKQELVWFNGSQNFDKIRFYPMTERLYWLAKSSKTKLVNNINHHDVFNRSEWKPVGTKGKHKRQFPEKMVEDLLLCFPNARVICDLFMGGGTVGKIALKNKRYFIGCEILKEFFDLSIKEINS